MVGLLLCSVCRLLVFWPRFLLCGSHVNRIVCVGQFYGHFCHFLMFYKTNICGETGCGVGTFVCFETELKTFLALKW